ncbi:MAG: ribokinase [Anaerolineales bacterium]|nr:ribokinase [Anaerolineales bacterium]
MFAPTYLGPVDYLVIGHLTRDITPKGPQIGGTALYAALTARALGLRVGIVTSWSEEIFIDQLSDIPIINYPTEHSTTFENITTPEGRIQKLHSVAAKLDLFLLPEAWRNPTIIHFGPVAQEIEPGMTRHFTNSLVGITPQGWLRSWDDEGVVHPSEWPEASFVLGNANAVVLSDEDVGNDEARIEEMATYCQVLVVTENIEGARVYWHGDVRRFHPLPVELVDDIGAGDIFAAVFFVRLYTTRDPWEAARFASQLASHSITRFGINSIPTLQEIEESMIEVL